MTKMETIPAIQEVSLISKDLHTEVVAWRLGRLRSMWAKRHLSYDKSKSIGRPYSERKKMISEMKLIEKMAEETKKAQFTPPEKWFTADYVDDIEKIGAKEFYKSIFPYVAGVRPDF